MEKHYLVYQITNLISDKIYIGIHATENIDDGYLGSGKNIVRSIEKYGIENFKKEILFDFETPEEMILKESELVDRKFIARKDVYNIALGGRGWLTYDTISVKDSEGNCFRVHKTDERWIKGELKSVAFGTITTRDNLGNTHVINTTDPRFVNGELVHVTKNTILVKDDSGKTFRISKEDPKYLNKEVLPITTGYLPVKDYLGKIYHVSTTDCRYLSRELIPIFSGCKHSVETKRKISENSKIHQKGEGNSQYGTCWIHKLDSMENKKIKKLDLESYIQFGWIAGRKMNF